MGYVHVKVILIFTFFIVAIRGMKNDEYLTKLDRNIIQSFIFKYLNLPDIQKFMVLNKNLGMQDENFRQEYRENLFKYVFFSRMISQKDALKDKAVVVKVFEIYDSITPDPHYNFFRHLYYDSELFDYNEYYMTEERTHNPDPLPKMNMFPLAIQYTIKNNPLDLEDPFIIMLTPDNCRPKFYSGFHIFFHCKTMGMENIFEFSVLVTFTNPTFENTVYNTISIILPDKSQYIYCVRNGKEYSFLKSQESPDLSFKFMIYWDKKNFKIITNRNNF